MRVNHIDPLPSYQAPCSPCLRQHESWHEQAFPFRAFEIDDNATIIYERFQPSRRIAVADYLHAIECFHRQCAGRVGRSEEHTSELQSLMRISYAVFCLK